MNLLEPKFRSYQPEQDFVQLIIFLREIESLEPSGEMISEESVQRTLLLPGHDPIQDRWVVEDPSLPGRLIGHCAVHTWVSHEGQTIAGISLTVSPAWRRQGIGSKLLEQAYQRANTLNAAQAELGVEPRQSAGLAFLVTKQFRPAGAYTEMQAMSQEITQQPVFPDRFAIRAYADIKDLTVLTEAYNRCYAGLWGHQQVSEAEVAGFLPRLDLSGLFLLFDPQGEISGICRSEHQEQRSRQNGTPTGFIDAPGVVPGLRGTGLYNSLALHACAYLRQQGMVLLELCSWGDDPLVLASYEGLGFRVTRQVLAYRKEIGKPVTGE